MKARKFEVNLRLIQTVVAVGNWCWPIALAVVEPCLNFSFPEAFTMLSAAVT